MCTLRPLFLVQLSKMSGTITPADNIEMTAQDTKMSEPSSIHVDEVGIKGNGFAIHTERQRTVEEKRAEKRLLLKIDFTILPLLALVYFLASMASSIPPS